jgi:hypothetical protein
MILSCPELPQPLPQRLGAIFSLAHVNSRNGMAFSFGLALIGSTRIEPDVLDGIAYAGARQPSLRSHPPLFILAQPIGSTLPPEKPLSLKLPRWSERFSSFRPEAKRMQSLLRAHRPNNKSFPKHKVAVHSFRCYSGNRCLRKMHKGETTRATRSPAADQTHLDHPTKLGKETLHFVFIKAVRNVANIQNASAAPTALLLGTHTRTFRPVLIPRIVCRRV